MDAPQMLKIYTGYVPWNTCKAALAVCLFTTCYPDIAFGENTRNPVVEGFQGGSATLPCTLTGTGDLEWRRAPGVLILVKTSAGAVVITANTGYQDVISLVGGTNLRISSLDRDREQVGGGIFKCLYTDQASEVQETQVRVLALITGAQIDEASGGTVTVIQGVSKTLTCTVTGNPNPAPAYSWRVDAGPDSGQGRTFSLTADRSMTTVTCTATNTYSNGTELSRNATTASLSVHYLDSPTANTPVTATEGDHIVMMRCSAEGNPPPGYVWTRFGSSEVVSTTRDYTVERVERSAAGKYTCTVNNTAGKRQTVVNLIVQYSPKVSLTYNNTTQTLTCTAEGVPAVYSFRPWEHRLGGKLLRTLGTASTQSPATLKLDGTLTYEDTGEYVCEVSNGIKGEQRAELRVVPQTVAVFQPPSNNTQLTVNMTGAISVSFYTHSETPNVTVVWRKSGESTPLPSHREEAGPVSLTIHGQGVSIGGTVSTLTLTDVTVDDGGYYTVTVTNVIGGVTESRHVSVFINVTEQSQSPAERTTAAGIMSPPRDDATEKPQRVQDDIGAIAGGAGGAVVLILVIVLVIVVFMRRRRKSGTKSKDYQDKSKSVKTSSNNPETNGVNDPRWKQPEAELVDNDLYQSAAETGVVLHPKEPPKPGHIGGMTTNTSPSKVRTDHRWDQPGAELVDNGLYESAEGTGAVPVGSKPKNSAKPAPVLAARSDKNPPKPKQKTRKNAPDSSSPAENDVTKSRNAPPLLDRHNKPSSKKNGLAYVEVEFPERTGKPNVHPQDSPVTYASIANTGTRPIKAAIPTPTSEETEYELSDFSPKPVDKKPPKKSGLTYAEVKVSKGSSGKPTLHPREPHVDYASIQNVHK